MLTMGGCSKKGKKNMYSCKSQFGKYSNVNSGQNVLLMSFHLSVGLR